jgi:hypothetical protein
MIHGTRVGFASGRGPLHHFSSRPRFCGSIASSHLSPSREITEELTGCLVLGVFAGFSTCANAAPTSNCATANGDTMRLMMSSPIRRRFHGPECQRFMISSFNGNPKVTAVRVFSEGNGFGFVSWFSM